MCCVLAGGNILRCRGHVVAGGDLRRRRGRSTPSGTGILSPNAWAVPGWSGPHPATRNVPAGIGGTVVRGHRGSLQSAPVPPVLGGAALGSLAGRRGMSAASIHVKSSRVTNQIYFWYI